MKRRERQKVWIKSVINAWAARSLWDENMLNNPYMKAQLSRREINLMFDMTVWVTKHHGPCIKPKVPKILKLGSLLRAWNDTNPDPVFYWASAEFSRLLQHTQMTGWALELLPDATKAEQCLSNSLKSRLWQAGHYPSYYIDDMGRPIFYYDPRRCDEPGYLAGELIPKLAALKVFSSPKPPNFDAANMDLLIDVMGCHLGQGFTKVSILEAKNRTPARTSDWYPLSFLESENVDLPTEISAKHVLFITILGLSARRYTPEQIISHYGPILSKQSRKAIWPLYKLIEKNADFIKLLRIMTDNRLAKQNRVAKRSVSPERSLVRPVQSSDVLQFRGQGTSGR